MPELVTDLRTVLTPAQSSHSLKREGCDTRRVPPRTGTTLSSESEAWMPSKQLSSSTKCEIAVSINALVCAEVWGVEHTATLPPHRKKKPLSAMKTGFGDKESIVSWTNKLILGTNH